MGGVHQELIRTIPKHLKTVVTGNGKLPVMAKKPFECIGHFLQELQIAVCDLTDP